MCGPSVRHCFVCCCKWTYEQMIAVIKAVECGNSGKAKLLLYMVCPDDV